MATTTQVSLEAVAKLSRALYVMSAKLHETIATMSGTVEAPQKAAKQVKSDALNKIASKLYNYIYQRLDRSKKDELVVDRKMLRERFEFSDNGITCAMKELADKGYIKYQVARIKSNKSHNALVHFVISRS